MVAPLYLTPQYITLDMIRNQLGKMGIKLTTDSTPGVAGLYENVANDLIAKGEAYIVKTILSNFVAIPLMTIYNTDFNDLYNYPQFIDTYIQIRDLFISSSLWQIYKSYYGESGSNNGADTIRQYSHKISIYTNTLQRLDQAGNPLVKNAFSGLKVATNGSQRIAKSGRIASGIPLGEDQSWAAFNAVPNLRYGFNR